jgi:phage terminase Nu1 subunit (DNA packaging protein)
MIGIEAGGKAQYDDQLGCYAAYTDKGDFRAKTLDELAALVPLTAGERAELEAERAATLPRGEAAEVARLREEKQQLEAEVAMLRTVQAEMRAAVRADIAQAVIDALKG